MFKIGQVARLDMMNSPPGRLPQLADAHASAAALNLPHASHAYIMR